LEKTDALVDAITISGSGPSPVTKPVTLHKDLVITEEYLEPKPFPEGILLRSSWITQELKMVVGASKEEIRMLPRNVREDELRNTKTLVGLIGSVELASCYGAERFLRLDYDLEDFKVLVSNARAEVNMALQIVRDDALEKTAALVSIIRIQ
jgi:hypothetical protein